MTVFIALLRGINVGKAKRVPMAELRALLAELGYSGIATLLNSGNAVFHAGSGSAGKHALAISNALKERMQFDVPVIVVSARELSAIIEGNPLVVPDDDHPRFLAIFAQDPATLSGLGAVASAIVPPEKFAVGPGAAYLHCASGILESKAATALVGKAGKETTTRNWATVLKLQAMAAQAPAKTAKA